MRRNEYGQPIPEFQTLGQVAEYIKKITPKYEERFLCPHNPRHGYSGRLVDGAVKCRRCDQ